MLKKINATFGTPKDRWYRVEWSGHEGKDSWEAERSLVRQGCEQTIKNFWDNNNLNPSAEFIADPDDVWRCWTCGRGYKTERALSAHITRSHTRRKFHGSTADKDTRNRQHKETQTSKDHVTCAGAELENVWRFKYLGSWFHTSTQTTTS